MSDGLFPCPICWRVVEDGERLEVVGMNPFGFFVIAHLKADGKVSCKSWSFVIIDHFDGLVGGLRALAPFPLMELLRVARSQEFRPESPPNDDEI